MTPDATQEQRAKGHAQHQRRMPLWALWYEGRYMGHQHAATAVAAVADLMQWIQVPWPDRVEASMAGDAD